MARQKGLTPGVLGFVSCPTQSNHHSVSHPIIPSWCRVCVIFWQGFPLLHWLSEKPCHRVFDHLSEIELHQPDVKVITFNHEGIFSQAATDVDALKAFISMKGNLRYPIYVDVNRTAINGGLANWTSLVSLSPWRSYFSYFQTRAEPFYPLRYDWGLNWKLCRCLHPSLAVFIITTHDSRVHWVGNAEAEDLGEPLSRVLASLWGSIFFIPNRTGTTSGSHHLHGFGLRKTSTKKIGRH